MAILTGINCFKANLGSGLESCQPFAGTPNGFILAKKGWNILKSEDFNKAYVQSKIQDGTFIPFVGSFQLVSETPEATTEESQSGLLDVVRQGKPVITATYKKGYALHKALFSYNSSNQYDVLVTFETGYIMLVETLDGLSVKGFDLGMLNTNGFMLNNGTESESSSVQMQLTNPQEWNVQGAFLTDLDFNPNTEINGITDTVVTVANATATSIEFSVNWLHNKKYNVEGLVSANVKATKNGGALSISALNYSNGVYTATVSGLVNSDEVVIQLYDSVNNIAVAKVGNKFYKGTSPAFEVVIV